MALVRVLLADNHAALLSGLRAELGKEFEIVGAVEDGEQAVDAVRRLDPDVLVIDMTMPVLDGLQATVRVRGANHRTKIIFLTIHEQSAYIVAAFGAGANGYVTKRHMGTDLVRAIRRVLQGHTFISPSLNV